MVSGKPFHLKTCDAKSVIPTAALSPPPPDLAGVWSAFTYDHRDATARIALGQRLNDRPKILNPIREGYYPKWWWHRIAPYRVGDVLLTRPDLLDANGLSTLYPEATRYGATTLFDRWAYAAEWSDYQLAEKAARTLEVLAFSWVLTLKPRPRVTWVAPPLLPPR